MTRRWAIAAVVVLSAAVAVSLRFVSDPSPPRPAVLVVGDSLVEAAAPEATAQGPPGQVSVLAAKGASPCDVWRGFLPPNGAGDEASFRATVDSLRPRAVVLAFSGNAGTRGSGCPTAGTDYRIGQLLDAYRWSVAAMAGYAAGRGALVYLAAVPSRNPAVGEGWVAGMQLGFNGDPAFNAMLSDLAAARGWIYEPDPALQLAGPDGGWALRLGCLPADGKWCAGGTVQVRFGTPDAIHFDRPGTNGAGSPSAGSVRFAFGLVGRPLSDQGIRPLGLSSLA